MIRITNRLRYCQSGGILNGNFFQTQRQYPNLSFATNNFSEKAGNFLLFLEKKDIRQPLQQYHSQQQKRFFGSKYTDTLQIYKRNIDRESLEKQKRLCQYSGGTAFILSLFFLSKNYLIFFALTGLIAGKNIFTYNLLNRKGRDTISKLVLSENFQTATFYHGFDGENMEINIQDIKTLRRKLAPRPRGQIGPDRYVVDLEINQK